MKITYLGNICAIHINHSNERLWHLKNQHEYESEKLRCESQSGTDNKITNTRPATLIQLFT